MTDYTVASLSIEKIEEHAQQTLTWCPRIPSGAIDILAALRLPTVRTIHGTKTLRLKLVADELLPEKLAQVWAGGNRVTVTVSMSLWNRAQDYEPEALKDLRHEYSHTILHSAARTSSAVTLDRRLGGNAVHNFIDPDRRAENQADWLAACLAMPATKIKPGMDVRDISADWNVPIQEACWRLERVRMAAPKRIPDSFRRNLRAIADCNTIPAFAQALWDQLPCLPDSPSSAVRVAEGFMVELHEFRKCSQTGWAVEGGKIVPLMPNMMG